MKLTLTALFAATVWALPATAGAQFIAPVPASIVDSTRLRDDLRILRALHPDREYRIDRRRDVILDDDGREVKAPRWFFPLLLGGADAARELYSTVGYGVLGSLGANVSDSEALTTVDIITGAIGALPFGIRTAFVVAESDTATAMVDGMPQTVEGTRSDLTALLRNGGNIAARLGLPIFLTRGPHVRSAVSLAFEAGALGSLTSSDSLRGSGTVTLDGALAFSVRELTKSTWLGDFLVPIRVGYAGSTDPLEAGVIDRKGFGFLQVGAALTNRAGQFRVAVLWSRPFDPQVRERSPKFLVNFSAALSRGDGGGQ